ncbi:phage tail protein [Leminorella grimontii]|uniref:phage tail protein n=1 Tax=Leminorella grimontii TaxID=82981 RepID=UPI0021C489AA
MPIPCPMEEAPEGYLKCNGAAFDKELYPELAQGYPSGVLPDLRGEFIRGWDDGRGVDAGRNIGSFQSDALQVHNHYLATVTSIGGGSYMGILDTAFEWTPAVNPASRDGYNMTTMPHGNNQNEYGTIGKFASETRPRNVAFNFIVRAA